MTILQKINSSILKILFLSIFLYIGGCANLLYRSIPLKDIAKAKGKYAVGTQNIYVVDSTRAMWFTDGIKGPRELSVKYGTQLTMTSWQKRHLM